MSITHILMDLDGTVFDFPYAEKTAFKTACEEFNIDYSDERYAFYGLVNKKRWQDFEEGTITKPELFRLRFADFLDKYKIDADPVLLNDRYRELFAEKTRGFDGAEEILRELKETYVLAAVTNGDTASQKKKLKNAHMEGIFQHLFISQDIGFPKPSEKFFDAVFDFYKDVPKENFLLVGDSLSSDIKGAVLSGIKCVWLSFNKSVTGDYKPDYVIENINSLVKILKEM